MLRSLRGLCCGIVTQVGPSTNQEEQRIELKNTHDGNEFVELKLQTFIKEGELQKQKRKKWKGKALNRLVVIQRSDATKKLLFHLDFEGVSLAQYLNFKLQDVIKVDEIYSISLKSPVDLL